MVKQVFIVLFIFSVLLCLRDIINNTTIVLILDGNSEIYAHVRSNICYSICLRHLTRLRAVINQIFTIRKALHAWATWSELPSEIRTMNTTYSIWFSKALSVYHSSNLPQAEGLVKEDGKSIQLCQSTKVRGSEDPDPVIFGLLDPTCNIGYIIYFIFYVYIFVYTFTYFIYFYILYLPI